MEVKKKKKRKREKGKRLRKRAASNQSKSMIDQLLVVSGSVKPLLLQADGGKGRRKTEYSFTLTDAKALRSCPF